MNDRLKTLAKKLCVTPLDDGPTLERYMDRWWLTRCREGDTALPFTRNAKTPEEALKKVEDWLNTLT